MLLTPIPSAPSPFFSCKMLTRYSDQFQPLLPDQVSLERAPRPITLAGMRTDAYRRVTLCRGSITMQEGRCVRQRRTAGHKTFYHHHPGSQLSRTRWSALPLDRPHCQCIISACQHTSDLCIVFQARALTPVRQISQLQACCGNEHPGQLRVPCDPRVAA